MCLVFACIAPHGAEIIPELAGDKMELFAESRKSMQTLAKFINKQKPQTIVVASPHNLRLEATIGVVTSEFAEGALGSESGQVKLRRRCDRQLAKTLIGNAKKARLPVVGANYGTSEGSASCMPMDWGTLIPLWFFCKKESEKPQIVIVTPSREIPLKNLTKFGEIIAETADHLEKRVAFVASADQGHAHSAKGPYGFNVASKRFDDMVRKAVLENDLKPLFKLPSKFIDDAKPDSLWQLAMLQGLLNRVPMKPRLLSYEVPTYYGMLCAAYMPSKSRCQSKKK
ncbi:MAG: extradiol ring-cleavage dioxygenase [Candidatus Bathyarchaeota archaeon]|nr:extradiol ring-cleavage dioxygenase [Candidatus Bathyarchaeota archaeon]